MRLVTYTRDGGAPTLGALTDGDTRVVELSTGDPRLASMLALMAAGGEGLELAREAADRADRSHAAADAHLLAPIPVPAQIRDFLCFEEHLRNSFAIASKATGLRFDVPEVWYRQPIYYKGNRFSCIGTETDIAWPAFAEHMDYELELACWIGRGGADIAAADAGEHIFGYSIFNDVTARDAQLLEAPGQLGPAKGKDFDTGNIIGPCIVTADEVDADNLTMVARINGEEVSRGSSSTMHWKFADVIAHVSRSETLHPGEMLGSGTVGGGCAFERGERLAPGDVIELEVEGIGVLRNRIVREGA
jgi:2-keto-4-pentenoate hydratase/2-oxohepta-3-ene-1,7-dioic acid hydratase in catechol pathway